MSRLSTDFNVAPYFDDFDEAEAKNYHRILFKPSIAVQARELTQLQSILQEQIARFGSYMFKDGSIVDRCAISYIPQYPVVYVENQFDSNTSLAITDVPSNYLLVSNTGVRAAVSTTRAGFELTYPNTNRFYVNYLSTGSVANSDVYTFSSGEKLYLYNANQNKFGTLDANNLVDTISIITSNGTANATGTAYGITVSDGIVFQKGFFINVKEHTIPVREHDTSVNNYVVGFDTLESIVNSNQDESLLSNAAGFFNHNAPGADRLQLEAVLVSKPRSETANSKNFFAIVEFDSAVPNEQNSGEEGLNKVLDVLAGRTLEVSGDYTVKPFVISTEPNANSSLFNYNISSGITYVNGYRVEKINGFTLSSEKAQTVREAESQIITGNYGNYVLVDELVGSFDFDNVTEVSLYDTAQNSVSEYEGSGTAPSGTIVGKANVLAVQYSTGSKGTPDARYRLYLFNVRMNSGKTFANDVKSFAGVNAKADVVLEANTATIKDSAKNTLVFPFGVDAVKRLRDSSGAVETSFVFRDVANATMAANGVATFTINSPANGGQERINASPGVLSSALASQFNIITSSAAYSANLAGTINYTAASVNVVGTGTSFTTQFVVGDMIRVNANTTSAQVRRVASVVNTTFLTLDAVITTANTAATYGKYYPAGHVVNLDFSGSINVISNTQFVVDTNLDIGTGTVASGTQTLIAQYPVLRTNAVQTKKEVKKSVFVKIDCSNNVANSVGPWDLGFVDVAKVRNVYVGTTYSTSNPERTSWFTYDNGQRDNMYDHGRLIVKTANKASITSATKMLVELDYFTANNTTGVGFYSVDSYPIDDANTSNTVAITTAEIPRYFSASTNGFIDLRNAVDFRPSKFNTANGVTDANTATINPAVSNSSFNVPATGQYLIDPDSNFAADMEYYLPRRDLIVVNKFGDITIRMGNPGEAPLPPINELDTAVLAEVYVAAYPTLTEPQAIAYNRSDLAVDVDVKTNRVYTQKDIGTIDRRLSAVEYYAVLNMLEQKAKDVTITDENGLDRFKNGIFAEPFNNHDLGKTSDIEYSISVDTDAGVARPNFKQTSIDFAYRSELSAGVAKTGNFITLPYTHELFADQRYATGTRNCTGSYWAWNGKLNLYPAYDHFTQESESAPINVTLDQTEEVDTGTVYGSWRTTSSRSNTTANGRTRTTTTTTNQSRTGTVTTAETVANTVSLGKYVTDVSVNPYMRSREVSFIATGMKPNTVMHVFFDNVRVDQYCAPGVLSGLNNVESGQENKILNRSGDYGTAIKSDSTGTVRGVFKIPADTFKTGDRELLVVNVDDLVVGAASILTKASSIYTASSVAVSYGSTTLTTLTTEVNVSTVTENRTLTQTTTTVIRPPQERFDQRSGPNDGSADPVAQSFTISAPSNVSGAFVSKIGIFFKTKDPALGCSVYIVPTELGLPKTTRILAKAYLSSAEITTSDDGSVETQFVFTNPVYLENDTEYAYIVKPDGNSPEYNVWISTIGSYDIVTGEQVFSNPYSGMLFVSANMNSWTANQTEDMKFRVYRAKFNVGSGNATFTSEDDEFVKTTGLTKANTSYRVETGDAIIKVVGGNRVSNSANLSYATGRVQAVDEATDTVQIDSSNGNLNVGDVIEFHRAPDSANMASFNANTLIATTNVAALTDVKVHAVVPRFATITPALTSAAYKYTGVSNTYQLDASATVVSPETETEFLDIERVIASRSNEVDNGSFKSGKFTITLTTFDSYVSPVIDLRRKSAIAVENVINNDSTNEYTRYGNAVTKYVSQNVVLDDAVGDAEDVIAYIGGYRPAGTDIELYVKVLGSEDGDIFDDKLWTKMPMTTGSSKLYSSPIDTGDFREFQYGMPTSVVASSGSKTTAYLNNGIVQYARSDGSIISRYKTFCFKIVLLSNNATNVPRLNDFRALALQK